MRDLLAAREEADQLKLGRLRESSALVVDDRRRRPLYFDGRFLAARDLTREQQYFLARQADLGRAGGPGVVQGLHVRVSDRPGDRGQALVIAPGHGVTPSGESVVLPDELAVPLADVPSMQQLDAAFGLLRRPAEPARSRTGLFILALRPVEFSANPVASYPTSITDKRTVEDGDIVEGVAASLIPYPDPGGDGELSNRRARTARALFVEGSASGFPVDALPLAMLALERNIIRWLDVAMVRREVGAQHGDVLGLGLAPRAVREAHLLQYDRHLLDVLQERETANRGQRFAASEHFLALPPGGRLPAAAVNTSNFTQSFFPPDVTVDLSIIPDDEVPALLEESLLLPPIDLTLPGEALASTAVLVVLPVPPGRVRALKGTLDRLQRPVPSTAPGLIALRRPLEILRGIRLARLPALAPAPADATQDGAWAAEVSQAASRGDGLLWYVRRRNVDYRSDVVGIAVRVTGDETGTENRIVDTLRTLNLEDRVNVLRRDTTALGGAEMLSLLGSRSVADSPLLARAVVHELEVAAETRPAPTPEGERPPIDRTTILAVSERFAEPGMGEGLRRLEAAEPTLTSEPVVEGLATSMRTAEIDRVARALPESELSGFARALADAATTGDATRVNEAISAASLRTRFR
jgi:hypothetical protein